MKKLIVYILLIAALLSLAVSCTGAGSAEAKERLKAAIATELPADRYTAASYKSYKEAFDAAVKLSKNEEITALAADRAVDALNAAKKTLVLKNDFSELQRQVDFFAGIIESEYSADSYAAYKDAYEQALVVLQNDAAKQSEINTAASRMESAKRALMKIPDTSNLRSLVEAQVDASIYTRESYATYQSAVEKGKAVLSKECPTPEEIRLAENMLIEAYASLMLRGNTGVLSELVRQVKEQKLIPDASGRSAKEHFAAKGYNAVTAAIAAAEACMKQGDASENELNAAENALRAAVASLVDITPLLDAYDRAGQYSATIDNKEYTEESYKRLSEAMAVCDGLMKNPDVSKKEITDAVSSLNAVIKSMERVSIVPDGLKDKNLSAVLITVGKSSVILSDYFADYSRFFRAIYQENTDFAFDATEDSVVFRRGKCTVVLTADKLTLRYGGDAAVSEKDLGAFTAAGVKINESDRAIMSDRFFDVPTDYREANETVNGSAVKVAYIVYENETDGLTLTIRYDLKNALVLDFEFTCLPPEPFPPTPAE